MSVLKNCNLYNFEKVKLFYDFMAIILVKRINSKKSSSQVNHSTSHIVSWNFILNNYIIKSINGEELDPNHQ